MHALLVLFEPLFAGKWCVLTLAISLLLFLFFMRALFRGGKENSCYLAVLFLFVSLAAFIAWKI